MAWYSLYKWFIRFRKLPYDNMVIHYRRYLYDTWFNSLSEEDQKLELHRIQENKERRKRQGRQALMQLNMMLDAMNRATHGSMSTYTDIFRNMW